MIVNEALDPNRDLSLERLVDVVPEIVWRAWTDPAQLMRWYAPRPWSMVHCEVDLRPGGVFRTVMRSPEGRDYSHLGCYLDIVPGERLVWTTLLGEGYRPLPSTGGDVPPFTAVISIAPHAAGTRYVATAKHAGPSDRQSHEARGFHQGWSTAADQMDALCRTLRLHSQTQKG